MRGIDFNDNWLFRLEEEFDPNDVEWGNWNPWQGGDVNSFANILHDDYEGFKTVRLPHDWSVEFDFDTEKGEGCTGYLLGGKGVYRKHFTTTEEFTDKRVFINFDGIYNRATIYINKKLIKFHPYGYAPCVLDLTDYLKPLGEENVISVQVDHSRYADSRWYTGSGIYRKVSLHILPKLNIPIWGVYFHTPVITDEKAVFAGEIEIANNFETAKEVTAKITVIAPNGDAVCEKTEKITVEEKATIKTSMDIVNPVLWNLDSPNQYTINVDIFDGEEKLQTETVKIGVRSSYLDADKGYFLNGKNTKIKGVCVHHDAGLVGAAVPNDVWRRRFEILKTCGCNAIRTSHNPFAEDFFDLCDEMGFLVQEEFYDEWDYAKDKRMNCFNRSYDYITRGHDEFFHTDYIKEDLQNVAKRDRNHPCIIQWSLGNEIEWTYPSYEKLPGYFTKVTEDHPKSFWGWDLPPNSIEKIRYMLENTPSDPYSMRDTCRNLASWTREIDNTRTLSVNWSVPCVTEETDCSEPLDLVGYSHRHMLYEYGHEHYPNKPIFGGETGRAWYDWEEIDTKEYVCGGYIWTGYDYMGEANGSGNRAGDFGIIDFIGSPKNGYHVFNSWWAEKPVAHICTALVDNCPYKLNENGEIVEKVEGTWKNKRAGEDHLSDCYNYNDGDMVLTECYTNCDEVTLYVNGKAIETKYLKDNKDRVIRFITKFEKGEISVIAKKNDVIVSDKILTNTEFANLEITTDKTEITTDFDSVAHIIVNLKDTNGNLITDSDREIVFDLSGDYINMGVDNGYRKSMQKYQSNKITTHRGVAMMIVQGSKKGEIKINATTDEKNSNEIVIKVK